MNKESSCNLVLVIKWLNESDVILLLSEWVYEANRHDKKKCIHLEK